MTDQEHADKIAWALSVVRAAIRDATAAGLTVDIPQNFTIRTSREFPTLTRRVRLDDKPQQVRYGDEAMEAMMKGS